VITALATGTAAMTSGKLNIVQIVADISAERMSGSAAPPTSKRRIWKLAAEGVKFTQFHVQPMCTPNQTLRERNKAKRSSSHEIRNAYQELTDDICFTRPIELMAAIVGGSTNGSDRTADSRA